MPTFHSPHPGFMGAAAHCPHEALVAARSLEDRAASLDDAVQMIRQSVPGSEVTVHDGCILMTLGNHCWRIICFDPT